MMLLIRSTKFLACIAGLSLQLVRVSSQSQIPSVTRFTPTNGPPFTLTPAVQILVDSRYEHNGSPSLLQYAQTFRNDLIEVTGFSLPSVRSTSTHGSERPSIFLTLNETSNHTLYNGKPTGEGYDFSISPQEYIISGAASTGTWWGTRTLLQQLVQTTTKSAGHQFEIPAGTGSDSPGWEIRGFMLDAGRHWFDTIFLADLCTYASFWKVNEFHIHASDNLWIPQILYGTDWRTLYSGFRFQPPPGSPVYDLVPYRNESWSYAEFTAMQTKCAAHGVTLVPEIDTPGHSLVFSQWKPQLMLNGTPDSLNLTYPETIPTIKSVWTQFLSWFTSAEISIGADEYSAALADQYISFVNEMSNFIKEESEKSIRIWGTYEPSNTSSVSTNITIQHWDFPGGDIPVQLLNAGYDVINSEQAFLYLDGKIPAEGGFPQELNETLLWTGAPGGQGWAPNIFTTTDPTNNTRADDPHLRGSIFALWNDWGPNATTPLEIYYQLSKSLALFGEKTWAGSGIRSTELTQAQFDLAYPHLNAIAPGQNLNRAVKPAHGDIIYSYARIPQYPFETNISSVGPPYTLSFKMCPGPVSNASDITSNMLFEGEDSALYASSLTFSSNAEYYPLPLNFTFPSDKYTSVVIRATRQYTYADISVEGQNGGNETYWYQTTMNIWGDYLAMGNMSFAAPAKTIGCKGFKGDIKDVVLQLG
ncbi:glycoside hydrolase family 20 protein [Hygrophoropsis aurantiaca]|uniref:Glycoside hydrolase family 20 protein n=1 Tax=Hygrophoropsis aurantiaca TaxID=72124 RepID=A0ACB8AN84_9AGAM|nr:glycoside hydrolase family 20 protein [Hygrophoropsis aurantiaca]